jgi:hypothetical protein
MSQFPPPPPPPPGYPYSYGQPQYAEPATTSGLAITALVLSLIGIIPCCGPVTAPLGALLGLIAFFTIGSNPQRKGRGMALAALLIGVILIVLYISAFIWGYNKFAKPLESGPGNALQAGFAGNIPAFKAQFFGSAQAASDAEAQAFVDELRSRYGDFRASFQDDAALRANPPTFQDMMQPVKEHPYRFQFANKTVSATVEYAAQDPQTGEFFWGIRFARIVVHDPDLGDLIYPAESAATTAPTTRPRPGRSGASP